MSFFQKGKKILKQRLYETLPNNSLGKIKLKSPIFPEFEGCLSGLR